MTQNTGTWAAFLLCCFAVVGMMGLFACYAAPLTLERAMARDAVLDRVLASPADTESLERLRPELGDSAALVLDGSGPLAPRVATARAAMHATLLEESEAIGFRLRLELVVITAVSAAVGVGLLLLARRQPGSARPSIRS